MTVSRLIRLAVAPLCLAGLLSGTALATNTPGVWSGLWRTPDQQGQALLDAGQPAQAAARFHDPRLRAYADLEAGRQAEAAKLLAPFSDAQSEYNRGNALARSGQLQPALAAYDAALKQTPADRDIRHNRDLVAQALRQQQQHQQQQQQQRQQQSPQSSGQNGRQGQQSQAGAQQQGRSGSQQSGKGSQSPGQTAASGSRAGANPSDKGARQLANSNGSTSSREAPGQAQRDAAQAAALARAQHREGAKPAGQAPGADSLLTGGGRTPKQKPETEKQLALDQWLRQIPDSAAGLLQRKFLIEHMMRQQDVGDAQDSGQ